jgi:hypothetical protein
LVSTVASRLTFCQESSIQVCLLRIVDTLLTLLLRVLVTTVHKLTFQSNQSQQEFQQVSCTTAALPTTMRIIALCFIFVVSASSPSSMNRNKPPAEANSCRKIKFVSQFSFCPPCWEQHNMSDSFYRNRNLSTKGCCHRLYPEKAEGWKPILADGPYWEDHDWKGLSNTNRK